MIEAVNRINEALFWALNSPMGRPVDYLVIAITCTGYSISAFFIGIAGLKFYGGLNRRNAALLFAAMLVGGGVVHGIKAVYVKDRPLGYFSQKPELKAKLHAPFRQLRHRTFPSGHSQTAFSVAAFLVILFRRNMAAWLLWAALVAVSRVYLGLHFPIDILAGGIIGAFFAWLVLKLAGEPAKTEEPAK